MSLDAVPRLIVEGTTDEYALTHLLIQHGIFAHALHGKRLPKADEKNVQIVVEFPSLEISAEKNPSGGREKLLKDWSVRLRSPKHRAIGLVLDADTVQFHGRGPQATWLSVRQKLMEPPVNISLARDIEPDGFFGLHGETKTPLGVWIMPDNQSEGSLEDFLKELIDDGDTLIELAEGSARLAKLEPYFAPFDEKDLQQAALATWLAWQKDPPMTFGTAFKHHRFAHDAHLATRFVEWVRRLMAGSTANSEVQQETPP